MSISKLSLVALLAITANTATADGFYAGGGLGYYSSTSEGPVDGMTSDPAESEATYFSIGATAGYRMDLQSTFVAGEVDVDFILDSDFEFEDLACSDGAIAPYYCEHTYTARFRGMVGTEVAPGFEAFAMGGIAVMTGEGAVDTNEVDTGTNSGFTIGAGAQADVGTGKVRFEVNYDQLENSVSSPTDGTIDYEPTLESVSAKVTYLLSF